MAQLVERSIPCVYPRLEVSQIARSISSALRLDSDLTEAIALGHDLGHTPYGHVGERTLHEIMTPHLNHELGNFCPLNNESSDIANRYNAYLGFKHNLQSLKNAMVLEKNYGDYGLDLTNFTLFGIQFHSARSQNHYDLTLLLVFSIHKVLQIKALLPPNRASILFLYCHRINNSRLTK